jgi:mannose-1-phosphate guanylyltransferase
MLYAVIMAGGSGTRFWPRSRKTRPKHHIAIAGEKTMIQQSLERLEGEVPLDQILVVTVAEQVEMTREQLPELPPENIISEPQARNTAAAVGLGAIHVKARSGDTDATMLVVTADHVIQPKSEFWENVRSAECLAADGKTLVIFGIPPTWGNPGFGYILRGQEAETSGSYEVERFEEKPDPDIAAQWAESGDYYWNSGMFVWKTSTILGELGRHEPEIHASLARIEGRFGSDDAEAVLVDEYSSIKKLPIDKAVMERAEHVKVVEATFGWDDVGSWKAVPNHHQPDESGNTVVGSHEGIETSGCIIAAEPGHLIATYGVEDLIIVQTGDATLVCRKDDAENVKKIVELIQERGLEDYL